MPGLLPLPPRRTACGSAASVAKRSESAAGLRLQSPSYTGEVVITMPDGVILKHELAGEWGIGVERHRRGLIELLVAESPDCGRGCRAVAPEQIQRRLFGDGVVLLGVPDIHLVDGIRGHARHRL